MFQESLTFCSVFSAPGGLCLGQPLPEKMIEKPTDAMMEKGTAPRSHDGEETTLRSDDGLTGWPKPQKP